MFYAFFSNLVIVSCEGKHQISDYTKNLLASLGKDPDAYLAKFMGL